MKKGKRKLYFGHGVWLDQSPSEDDFRSDRREDTTGEAPVKAGCSTTSTPPSGRKKKEGRLLRKSSTKRKLLENSSLSLQTGTEKDNGDPSEMILRKKSGRSGLRIKKGTDKRNISERKQWDKNVESGQMSHYNLVESEASDYDFSSLYEAASHKISQNHRLTSKGPDMRDNGRDENLVIGEDGDASVKDSVESNQKSLEVSEQLHGSQTEHDDARQASETQEMFITQKDPRRRPKELSPQLAVSRNLMAEYRTQKMKSARKQHHLTVSQVKQLNRSNLTKAVMARHSSCPKKHLVPCFSQNKNQDRVRAERFLRKVKELQEKRKMASSQVSSLEQSPGDSQLSPSHELSESPQELASGTQMFVVSGEAPESVETESQSLIPPMVADDDSEEEPEEDGFKKVLAMRLARRKQRRRRKSSGIFGLSPLEETQENEIGNGEFLDVSKSDEDIFKDGDYPEARSQSTLGKKEAEFLDVSKSDENIFKDGDYPEARSQSTLGKKEADLSQEPAVKEGIGSTAEEDVNVGSSNTPKDKSSFVAPIPCDIACKPANGLLFSTQKEDQLKAAESSNIKETSTRMKDVMVLETQSERIEPEIGEDETVPQKNDVTVVPDSHDLSESSLPRYHFTSDDNSSDELHDESVTQAVSKFLDTFEDCGDDRPPWEEANGQESKPGATKEKTSDTLKSANGCSLGGGDEHFDDIEELETLHSGPVTKKKARRINKEVMNKFSRRLNMFEDRKKSVSPRKDQDTNLLKEGKKLPIEANKIFVTADVHVVDIPTVTEEASNHSSSVTSGHKKNSSTVNSSQSRSHEEVVCAMETSKINTGRGTTIDAANVSTDSGDSSQETCLPEDYDNVGSVAQETLSPRRSDEGGELGKRERLVGGVSSSANAVCEVTASSGMGDRLVDSPIAELAVTSLGECGKCKKVKTRTTYAQTDLTMQDLESQDYFDFCMELKRLLLEYDKSIITTSGSSSFGSCTSDNESRDNHKREDLMALARRMCDRKVGDKSLSSDEATFERFKRRKKTKMVDISCQMGSPSKGLEKSESKTHSEKVSTPKENLSENFADLSVDMEELGGVMDTCLNARENSNVDMDGDVTSGNENLADENDLESKKRKVENGKSTNAKKRKKNDENENFRQTKKKKKKKVTTDDPPKGKKEKLADGKTKKKKKKKPTGETSLAGRKKKLEKDKTKKGKKVDDTEVLGQTRKEKKAKNSNQILSVLNIPVESIPSPEELEKQWREKVRKRRKHLRKAVRSSPRKKREVISYQELSPTSSDSFGEVSGLKKGSLKKKRKLKKKGKDSEVVKTWKQRVLEGDLSSSVVEEPDRMEKGVSSKRKKVHKHKKKKRTSDDLGDEAFQDIPTRAAGLLLSPLEQLLQHHNISSDDSLS